MNPAPIVPKSKEERDAIFAKLFANLVPADRPKPSPIDQLEEYREQIEAKRKEGFSLRQVCRSIREEPVRIRVSAATLMKFLHEKPSKKNTKKPFILRPIIPLDPPVSGRKP